MQSVQRPDPADSTSRINDEPPSATARPAPERPRRFDNERFVSLETRAFASVLAAISFTILSAVFIALSDVLEAWVV